MNGLHNWEILAAFTYRGDLRYGGMDRWIMDGVSEQQAWAWGQKHYSRGPDAIPTAYVVDVRQVP